jgi:heterodisulfide reductase subunit A-like polyferredoxin/coenzyme F420-reducing hydrogenase delta subunit
MNNRPNIGVFLCQCGSQIEPLIDLNTLKQEMEQQSHVGYCEVMPYSCLKPGIEIIARAVADKRLNRVIIAGCEGRLMLKKMENELKLLDLHKGQIDMVNLRGHIAAVSDRSPAENALKAKKLLIASVAELAALTPSQHRLARIDGPVMITGGGAASFSAARELSRNKIDYFLSVKASDVETVLRQVHQSYPGERQYDDRLSKIVREAVESPHATLLPEGRLVQLTGVTGNYTLTYETEDGGMPVKYKAGAIIACLDAQLTPPGPEFGHDGKGVMTQPEMEEFIRQAGSPKGTVIFWISDHEYGQANFAQLSARSAWNMARHIRECSKESQTIILYDETMPIPLSAAERALNRKLGIMWVPYDKAVRPSVQADFITFCSTDDHVEHEFSWDKIVLSPVRGFRGAPRKTAEILGLIHKEGVFITGHHAKVRPEMVGREETYLAGSARYPCDLHEALTQGQKSGANTARMLKKAADGRLYVPRIVCVVDPEKCIGCGQCQELCDCGGIGVDEGPGGGLPRIVDPMVCTGGGTCAAACPYHALVLQNNSNDQREARVAALSAQMGSDEIVAIGCVWGGLPAADNAGKEGLTYDSRVHILGVPCVGQIDPCIMARALLEGAPGLILVGCLPEECHHSYGVDHAWSRVSVLKKLLTLSGLDRRRIALAHADLNKPKEFIRTVESFTQTISAIGPIEKTAANREKLEAIYNLIKFNSRVRHLLSASLRRPWEKTYRGEQRHALDYDRDFLAVIEEEFLQQRLLLLLEKEKRPLRLQDCAGSLHEDEVQVADCLWNLVTDGSINLTHQNREAFFCCQA